MELAYRENDAVPKNSLFLKNVDPYLLGFSSATPMGGKKNDVPVSSEIGFQETRGRGLLENSLSSEESCLLGWGNLQKTTVLPLDFPFFWDMLDMVFYPACVSLLVLVLGLLKVYFPFGFTYGPQVQYRQLSHLELEKCIQDRYQDKIVQVRELGFKNFCSYSEVMPKYSVVWAFLEFLKMRKSGEVVHVQHPLQLTLLHPLLVMPDQATYASITAKGVWFVTRLSNGTGIITGTYSTHRNFFDHKQKIKVHSTGESIEYTWNYHREILGEFRGGGITERQERNFEDFSDIVAKRDKSIIENNSWME